MHDMLRDRIWRHLEALPEAQLYQVLDFIEFLSSKYAREVVRPPSSSIQRFGERLEDKLRGNRVGLSAIRSTLEVVGSADKVVSGLAEAGRSLLREVGVPAPAEGDRPKGPPAPPQSNPGPAGGAQPAQRDSFPIDG